MNEFWGRFKLLGYKKNPEFPERLSGRGLSSMSAFYGDIIYIFITLSFLYTVLGLNYNWSSWYIAVEFLLHR